MKKYEVVARIYEDRKIMIDCENYPTKEDVIGHLESDFPEWASDNESEYILHSLGFEIIHMKKLVSK